MPPRRLITPTLPLTISLPQPTLEKLEKFLTSDRLGKVPKGAYQRFFVERIEEFFRRIEASGNDLLKEIQSGITRDGEQTQPDAAEDGAGAGGDGG